MTETMLWEFCSSLASITAKRCTFWSRTRALATCPIQLAFARKTVIENRFFHDGVRLQAGRVLSAASQLRALARVYESSQRLRDITRETGHTEHLGPQNHQHRRPSSSGGQRRRPSAQKRPTQQTPPKPKKPSPRMLPKTVLLAYDSCSTESEAWTSSPVGRREDGSDTAANRHDSLTRDGGVLTPAWSRRHSSSGSRAAERREGRHDLAKRGEGGRRGVTVRVVEFKPDRGEGRRHEEIVCRGIGQVGGGSSTPLYAPRRPTLGECVLNFATQLAVQRPSIEALCKVAHTLDSNIFLALCITSCGPHRVLRMANRLHVLILFRLCTFSRLYWSCRASSRRYHL